MNRYQRKNIARRYAKGQNSVYVYGPGPSPDHVNVHQFVPFGGKWSHVDSSTVHRSMLNKMPNAMHVNEANRLGIASGNPITPHNEHLTLPMAEEVQSPPPLPPGTPKTATPTPPRMAYAPKKRINVPNRKRPPSVLEEEDPLPYKKSRRRVRIETIMT